MEKYLAIAIPEPTVLLGRELKPLSIGHLLFLERFECVPVDHPDKLVTAALICSLDYDEILPTLRDPWLSWRVAIWRWRLGEPDWPEKYALWENYFSMHTSAPSVIRTSEGSSPDESGTPFYQHLKVTLQAKLGYSPQEALECPFGQALFDYYAFHEIEGNVNVCDEEHRQAMRDMADANHDRWVEQARRETAERVAAAANPRNN